MNDDRKAILQALQERVRWLREAARRLLHKASRVDAEIERSLRSGDTPPPPRSKDPAAE